VTTCGTVERVTAVEQPGSGTGLGAIAGGVLGAVVGNQVGGR
jgi:outer membrane lipoprotein SlyB